MSQRKLSDAMKFDEENMLRPIKAYDATKERQMQVTSTGNTSEINRLFAFHKLNDVGMRNAVSIAELFTQFTAHLSDAVYGEVIEKGVADTSAREWAIVKTKLEEAAFFAKKAMALQSKNQETN